MANEPLLILETDPEQEQKLNDLLSGAGYQVYAADRVSALLNAVKATRFPVVLVDSSTPDMTPGRIAAAISEAQPDTMVLFTGSTASTSSLLSVLRNGGADFITKPYAEQDLLERIRVNLQRRSRRRRRARTWQKRAKAAEHSLKELKTSAGDVTLPHHYVEFGEYALQKFLELERRSMELERQIARVTRQTEERDVVVDAWVAHGDAEFARGVCGLGQQLSIDFAPPLSTGGEVLDKIGDHPPAIVVLGDQLPDIPAEFVVETVRSQHPALHIVVVNGWGTPTRSVTLVGGSGQPVERPMDTVDALADVLREARERCVDTSVGREFAQEFKRRHEEFLRRLAELKAGARD